MRIRRNAGYVHAGHSDIEQDDITRSGRQQHERVTSVLRGEDLVALQRQGLREHLEDHAIVIDSEQGNSRGFGRFAALNRRPPSRRRE